MVHAVAESLLVQICSSLEQELETRIGDKLWTSLYYIYLRMNKNKENEYICTIAQHCKDLVGLF